MALIICPECGAEVSDRAPACPSCGYPLVEDGHPTIRERSTPLGASKRNPIIGTVLIIVGLLSILLGIFLMGFIFGIIFVISGIIELGAGVRFFKAGAPCKCPYCGGRGVAVFTDKTYRCPTCKKVSTVDVKRNCLRTSR